MIWNVLIQQSPALVFAEAKTELFFGTVLVFFLFFFHPHLISANSLCVSQLQKLVCTWNLHLISSGFCHRQPSFLNQLLRVGGTHLFAVSRARRVLICRQHLTGCGAARGKPCSRPLCRPTTSLLAGPGRDFRETVCVINRLSPKQKQWNNLQLSQQQISGLEADYQSQSLLWTKNRNCA